MIKTGHIFIPNGIDRDTYIASCFTKEKFDILTNEGVTIVGVQCLENILDELFFPETPEELGSQVIIVYLEEYKIYTIIGVVSKRGLSTFRGEFDYKKTKTKDGTSLGIFGNIKNSKLVVFLRDKINKFCEFILEVKGNQDSKLKINSSGWVILNANTGIKIKSKDREIIISEDSISINNGFNKNFKIDRDKFIYKDNKNTFKIDSSGYNLGNINFEEYFTQILEFLERDLTLNTPMGPTAPGVQPTTAAPKLKQLKQKLKDINKK